MGMIRAAELQDAASIREIYNREIMHGVATFDTEPMSEEECVVYMRKHMVHSFFVYEEGSETGGFAGVSVFNEKKAYEKSLEVTVYVKKGFQGRGVGTLLLTTLVEDLRASGQVKTLLSYITSENADSIRLHEKLGFQSVGTLRSVGYKFGRYLDVSIYQLVFPS